MAEKRIRRGDKRNCAHCDTTFTVQHSGHLYCTPRCAARAHSARTGKSVAGQKAECPHCGKEYRRAVYNQKFCSHECSWRYRREQQKAEKNPAKQVTCPQCGKDFIKNTYPQTFCSKQCKQKFNRNPETKDKSVCAKCARIYPRTGRKGHRCPACQKKLETKTKANREKRKTAREHLYKQCEACGKEFVAWHGAQKYCSDPCATKGRKERQALGRSTPQAIKCDTCGKEFQQSKVFHRFCSKECRESNPVNAAKRQDARYWKQYGMSRDEVLELWEANGRTCPICGNPLSKPEPVARSESHGKPRSKDAPVVDHDHDSGAVRDLVCYGCNTGLGMFRDDPDVMRNAAAYINRHTERIAAGRSVVSAERAKRKPE